MQRFCLRDQYRVNLEKKKSANMRRNETPRNSTQRHPSHSDSLYHVSYSLSQGYESPPDRKKERKLRHACSNQINRMTPPERTTSRTPRNELCEGLHVTRSDRNTVKHRQKKKDNANLQGQKKKKKKRERNNKREGYFRCTTVELYIKQEKK